MKQPDYFSAKEAVQRLEKALGDHLIRQPETDMTLPLRPAGEHVLDLGMTAAPAKEPLADYVVRRRNELENQMEELAFLQDVAALMQKHARFFEPKK